MKTELTEAQRRILEGLALGNNHYVSASEMAEFGPLTKAEYVHAWMTAHGAPMWQIAPAGRIALSQDRGRV